MVRLIASKHTKERKQTKDRIEKVLESLSLFVVFQYIAFRFLQSTMFQFVYSDFYKTITILSLGIVGGIRFLYLHRVKEVFNRRLFHFIFLGCLAISFFYVAWKQDLKVLAFFPLVVLCLYNIKVETVFRGFSVIIGLLLIATIVCSLTGAVRNIYVFHNNIFRASYGICNTTDLAAYFVFLLLSIWCKKERRSWKDSIILSVLSVMFAIGTYWLTGSRTTLICCIMCFVASIWELLEHMMEKENREIRWVQKSIDGICIGALPVLMISLLVFSFFYSQGIPFFEKVDGLFSGRLRYTWECLQKFGLPLFGVNYVMHGNGGSIIEEKKVYDFLDSSYSYLLIRFGVLISVIIMAFWIWSTIQAIRSGKKHIAYAMTVIAIYGFVESHFVDINYNIFLFMPFCNYSVIKGKEKESSNWYHFFLGTIFFVIIVLILPKELSRLRTFFGLNLWNKGGNSFFALLWSASILFLLFVSWKGLCNLMQRENYRATALILICFVLGGIGVYYTNITIDRGMENYKVILYEEENKIHTILNAASQPVYAFDRSELYNNMDIRTETSVMSAEDLMRQKCGSLITDVEREISLPSYYGGPHYIQLSSSSGMYSYDPVLIESLSKMGYEWKKFYSSEQKCDLDNLAKLNSLSQNEDGAIRVTGPEHSISQNWYIDQWWGYYEFRISLLMDQNDLQKYNNDDLVCTFKIMGYQGEELLLENKMYMKDFNQEGKCEIIIPYTTNDNRSKTEILLFAEDKVALYVYDISWKRIS